VIAAGDPCDVNPEEVAAAENECERGDDDEELGNLAIDPADGGVWNEIGEHEQ
jgi:hypothetical protein